MCSKKADNRERGRDKGQGRRKLLMRRPRGAPQGRRQTPFTEALVENNTLMRQYYNSGAKWADELSMSSRRVWCSVIKQRIKLDGRASSATCTSDIQHYKNLQSSKKAGHKGEGSCCR